MRLRSLDRLDQGFDGSLGGLGCALTFCATLFHPLDRSTVLEGQGPQEVLQNLTPES